MLPSFAITPRIEERTLYPPIINYLQKVGFKAVGETIILKRHPDIIFQLNSLSFVIEIKIGKPETGLKAIAQAFDYARKLGTQNIIILIYPQKYKNQVILDMNIVTRIALYEKINALVLTEYWTESLVIEPVKLFEELKKQIYLKTVRIDFRTIVKLIENYVRDLNAIIYQIKAEELISEVVNKLDLFSSIGEIKDLETAKKQVINLASYLLFNQLLFYNIYKRKTNSESLPELDEIKSVKDLQKYFDKITDIDYQSIYKVNILAHIPDSPIVVNTINEVIKAIKLLRAEHITHDLAGRFFHDLIPLEVRKVLAAFYTHPVAAEILAKLTIDSYDETVIDPACGSGTLLVAAYRRKQELYQKLHGYKDLRKMHKKFIESDLTGIDIMPFAAHITTINLTMQNIEQETNVVRVATKDSLELARVLKTADFPKKGIRISPYTETIQKTLYEISELKIRKEGALSPAGKGGEFYLKPVDVVLMNPPFTDRNKIPSEIRKKLMENPLGKICGHQINLWGYFLALADLLLKPGGKMGVVIPINIARGKATEKIRRFLLENYHIKYIVKPIKDIAFSEGTSFRDILLIAEKRKPNKDDITKIIFIKKSIRELKEDDISKILNFNKELVDIREIKYSELMDHINNFMPLLMPEELYLITKILMKSDKLTNFDINKIDIGLPFRPKGVADGVFITRPLDESRVKNAKVIVLKEEKDYITIKIKGLPKNRFIYNLKREYLVPAIRTNTGIRKLSVSSNEVDYILVKKEERYWELLRKYGIEIPDPFPWHRHLKNNIIKEDSFLVIPRKIRLNSPNTFVISIYSEERLSGVGPSLWYLKDNSFNSKILNLFLNSILGILQISLFKSETLGAGYLELMKSDWHQFRILDIEKLSPKEKEILINLFEKLKKVEFPSIIEQLENNFWARIEIDKTILKILGFDERKINKMLSITYNIVLANLRG